MEDLTGKQFGSYQIVAPIGEGGMAAVYKAYRADMERYVALKVLPRHFAEDPQFLARFGREAKTMAQLQHPHILPVFNYGQADGYTYIVMPFVQSGTLSDSLKGKPLPLFLIRQVITQVGDALNYAHSRGLIHRDVKPSNVLVDEGGNCLLTDFGLARMVETSVNLTTPGAIMGTPAYMSPEQGTGSRIDKRSDVYALGVILYQMATGRVPYRAETPVAVIMMHIRDPLPPARALNPELPEAVQLVILKALSKNPRNRYQTAGDMVRAIQAAIPDSSTASSGKNRRAGAGAVVPDKAVALPDKTMRTVPGISVPGAPAALPDKTMRTVAKKIIPAAPKAGHPKKARPAWLWDLVGATAFVLAGGLLVYFGRGSHVLKHIASAALPSPAAVQVSASTYSPPISNATGVAGSPVLTKPDAEKGGRPDTPEFAMVRIPAGSNSGTDPDFRTYAVSLPEPLFMDACEVSKNKWDDVCSWAVANNYQFTHPGKAKRPNHPVVMVSWYDCVKWCNARSEKEGLKPCYTFQGSVYRTGDSVPECDSGANGYRLPTGDEWQYAMRGGLVGKRFPWGDTIQHAQANYKGCTNAYDLSQVKGCHPEYATGGEPFTSPVGSLSPNGYGLYDMAGNVVERSWTGNGTSRRAEGGSWWSNSDWLRCGLGWVSSPDQISMDVGFRTVRKMLTLLKPGAAGAPQVIQTDTPEYAMALLPAGANSGVDPDDGPYTLSLAEPLLMDACEVSKGKWDGVYSWAVENGYRFANPGAGKKPHHPVIKISWFDCVKWCNARSEREGLKPCYTVSGEIYRSGDTEPACDFAASGYRLPVHEEWKYAMRGGLSGKRFPWGDTIQHRQANYRGYTNAYDLSRLQGYHPDFCESGQTHTSPVGSFAPNGYGLYDMAGNVAERCWDRSGSAHISVGGDFSKPADSVRCQTWWLNYPGVRYPNDGFRTVRRVALSQLTATNATTALRPSEPLSPSVMALVPAGGFRMGDSLGDSSSPEVPVRTVHVSAFHMDKYEVTLMLWTEVKAWANTHGYSDLATGSGKAPNHPVHTVTWFDAVKWCNARSEREGKPPAYYADAAFTQVYRVGQTVPCVNWGAAGYRLPTEAEWEKAARGGLSGRRFPWSDTDTIQHSRANYTSSGSCAFDTSPTRDRHPAYDVGDEPYTSPVGSFAPNGYGLHDLAGNVWEMCWDWYSESSAGEPVESDPHGPAAPPSKSIADTPTRVGRGGCWRTGAKQCGVANRGAGAADKTSNITGFRCVLPLAQ